MSSSTKRKATDNGFNGISEEKAQRLGLPDRWLYCPPMGKIVGNKFLPIKTPLSVAYDGLMDERYKFHPEHVFVCAEENFGRKIGLWVDLTKTSRYYSKDEVEDRKCEYEKIALVGHKQSPTPEETAAFIESVNRFFESHPDDIVAVHCTHGFNRTGFLIAAYLVQECDYAIDMAVQEFAECRPNGIYKQDYLNDLLKRYGDDEEDTLQSPGRPLWENGPLSDEDYQNGLHFSFRNMRSLGNGVASTSAAVPSTSEQSNGHNSSFKAQLKNFKMAKFMDGRVPGVTLVENEEERLYFQEKARVFCKYKGKGFPGSQPVSLECNPSKNNLTLLATEPYMVSWKADGMRYLVLIEDYKQVYAFDRDNNVFQLHGLSFVNRKTGQPLRGTLVDAEMIIDKAMDERTKEVVETPRLLIYDIISFENIDIGKCSFDIRHKAIHDEIIQPRANAIKAGKILANEVIRLRQKLFWNIEYAYKIYQEKFMSNLGHGIDGLIFQPVNLPYSAGRCDKLLKWKPPEQSTVDFQLRIRKVVRQGELPHYTGDLHVLHLDTPFSRIAVGRSLLPYNNKIIECHFDPVKNSWVFERERTDKSHPNAESTAMSVCNTIKHPLFKEDLFAYIAKNGYRIQPSKPPQQAVKSASITATKAE